MIHIAAVEYLNTLPMLEGLRAVQLGQPFELHLANPAQCAALFGEGKVDVALVPVGALSNLGEYDIIGDYCIGCDGEVMTVALFSDVPLDKIEIIQLDSASRTSNLLLQILLKKFWKLDNIEFTFDDTYHHAKAQLIIGDRAFAMNGKTKIKFDLGKAWKEFSGLPFVFAVWVAKKGTDKLFLEQLNKSFRYGIFHLSAAIKNNKSEVSSEELSAYYTKYISYQFDSEKKLALSKFLDLANGLSPVQPIISHV